MLTVVWKPKCQPLPYHFPHRPKGILLSLSFLIVESLTYSPFYLEALSCGFLGCTSSSYLLLAFVFRRVPTCNSASTLDYSFYLKSVRVMIFACGIPYYSVVVFLSMFAALVLSGFVCRS